MSLWYESLGYCLMDSRGDILREAKCILEHLSMPVPRSWWQRGLEHGDIHDSYAGLLRDLQKTLMKVPELSEFKDFGLMIALAFMDDDVEDPSVKFGWVDSPYSLQEYVLRAKMVLAARHDLKSLARLIEKRPKDPS
jgi:hypothetical protein